MPGFQFELSQLVNVPGKDQQGRISGRMEFVNEETLYQVKWLLADLSIDVGMFKASEIATAQFPQPAAAPLATATRLPRNVLKLPKIRASKKRSRK